MFDSVLNTSLSQELLGNLYSDPILCRASGIFKILAYSALCFSFCFFVFFQVSAGIFNHIQHYWGIFMHIETLLRYIVAYSGILNTLCNPCILITVPSQPCHILSPSMFRGKGLFKTPWNVGQTYSETLP